MVVCFTGHRIISPDELGYVTSKLEKTIEKMIKIGYKEFAAGGALGFDTIAAETVLKLKESYPDIKLHLILPCPEQSKGWNMSDTAIYEQIKQFADTVTYTSDSYTKGCMFKRNRYLVDISSVCVSYLRKLTGGTAYTVKYAMKKGIQIIAI